MYCFNGTFGGVILLINIHYENSFACGVLKQFERHWTIFMLS